MGHLRAAFEADRFGEHRHQGDGLRFPGKQIAFNAKHGITPKGISKRIKDLIDGVYDADEAQTLLRAAQDDARYEAMSEKQIAREIKQLEKKMLDHAKNLEFEQAAKMRDQLTELKKHVFGVALASE